MRWEEVVETAASLLCSWFPRKLLFRCSLVLVLSTVTWPSIGTGFCTIAATKCPDYHSFTKCGLSACGLSAEPTASMVSVYLKEELIDEAIISGTFEGQQELPPSDLLGQSNSFFGDRFRNLAKNQLKDSGIRNSLFHLTPADFKRAFKGPNTVWVCNSWSESESVNTSIIRLSGNAKTKTLESLELRGSNNQKIWKIKSILDTEQELFGTMLDGNTLVLSTDSDSIVKAASLGSEANVNELALRIRDLSAHDTGIGVIQFISTGKDSDRRFSNARVPVLDAAGRITGYSSLSLDGLSIVGKSSDTKPVIEYTLLAGKSQNFRNFGKVISTLVFRTGDKYEILFDDSSRKMTLTCGDRNNEILLNECFGNLVYTLLELE